MEEAIVLSGGSNQRYNKHNSHGLGVDVYIPHSTGARVPFCPHGPTLLFERFVKDDTSKKFYACSACRDRKECSFFMWEDDRITDGKLLLQEHVKRELQEQAKRLRFNFCTNSQGAKGTSYCLTCSTLFSTAFTQDHSLHNFTTVEEEDLKFPTRILTPLANKRANAQYLFSSKSIRFLADLISRLGYTQILCIGAPKVHEWVKNMKSPSGLIRSLLLDLDRRYAEFNTKESFAWYNMFNNHFFDLESIKKFRKFLETGRKEDTLIVIDPPFGGLMTVLRQSMLSIWNDWRDINSLEEEDFPATILAFPYFLESHVKNAIPELLMMDYKVTYSNHESYNGKRTKKGSPVRFFTNIEPSEFVLPKEEGYRHCSLCRRFVSEENKHCKKCNSCTSKDGTTYVHCDACKMCVKPGRTHCDVCHKCDLPSHKCCENVTGMSCHICGVIGHKRKDCPQRRKSSTGPRHKKPKISNESISTKRISNGGSRKIKDRGQVQ